MMSEIKKVYYINDVFSSERKLTRLDNGEIRLEQSYMTTLTPFAMDTEHKDFVIFRLERGTQIGLFLWVYLPDDYDGKKVRLTMINGLMLYTKWSGEPIDVSGDFPEEAVKTAIQVLEAWPHEAMLAELKEIGEELSKKRSVALWKELDDHLLEDVITAKTEYNGIIYV